MQGLLDPLRVCWAVWLCCAVATMRGEGLAARLEAPLYANYGSTQNIMHVILDTRLPCFSAYNIEKLGVAWG